MLLTFSIQGCLVDVSLSQDLRFNWVQLAFCGLMSNCTTLRYQEQLWFTKYSERNRSGVNDDVVSDVFSVQSFLVRRCLACLTCSAQQNLNNWSVLASSWRGWSWIGTAEGRETDNIQSHVSHLKLSLPPSSGFIPQLPWLGGENNLQKNVSRPAETQTAYSIFCSCYQLKIIYEILVEWKVQVKGNIKEIAYLKFQGTFAVGLECSGLLHPDTIFARHAQTRLSGLRSAGPGSSCL